VLHDILASADILAGILASAVYASFSSSHATRACHVLALVVPRAEEGPVNVNDKLKLASSVLGLM
jgi:hypothetical protein